MRLLEEQIEGKTNVKLQCDDVVIQWMIRWAAMVVSKDGRTSYERRRGRACSVPVVTFVEKVWYMQILEQKERKDKIESEWHEGLWLGQSRSTNETIVGTAEGVVRAYATRRQDADERWKGDLIKKLQGTPARPDPNRVRTRGSRKRWRGTQAKEAMNPWRRARGGGSPSS